MTNNYSERDRKTMYFIGVTTSKSSIMKVFPKWAEYLSIDANLEGFDFRPNDDPEKYREVVEFIKHDSNSLGALVTTHKINLLAACHDLFDLLDPYAENLGEISSISKKDGKLVGHAKDPITSGLGLETIVDKNYWDDSGGQLLLLGAGGSSLALTLYLKGKSDRGEDTPARLIVTNRSERRLNEMKEIHQNLHFNIPTEYHLCPTPGDNDKILEKLVPNSMVVNATGLGKDIPGSPLTDSAIFPENGIVWEFNYRGDLIFLDQAESQKDKKNLTIEDGWVYFLHGWTRVIAEVFNLDLPTKGEKFNKLSDLARSVR